MKFCTIQYYLTATILLLLTLQSYSQPGFKWAKQIAGPSYDRSHAVAIDHNGNVYAAGSFENTVDFNSGNVSSNFTSVGMGDVFISQYDASGKFVWTKTMGGTGMDVARALTVDNAGDLITTGTFENVSDLDPTSGVTNAGIQGSQNIFINKLGADGKFKWSQSMSSTQILSCNSIKTDSKNNIYITGSFKGTVDFNPGPGVYNLTANDRMRDMFILKLDVNGGFIWAKTIAANCNDLGNAFEIDQSGNVFVTGSFYNGDVVDFDPGTGVFNSAPSTSEDVFLLKLDEQGNFEWVNHLKGTFYNAKTYITIDKNSNVYLAGNFHKTADIDAGPGSYIVNASGVLPDAFISKVDAEGKFIWAKQFKGVHEAGPVTFSHNGEILFTGMYSGTVDFDPGTNNFDLNSAGKFDIFLCRLDGEGTFICAGSLGGSETDRVSTLLVDNNNNVFVSGAFIASADVDPGSGTFNISPKSEEVFLCKLGECGMMTEIKENIKENNIKVYPNPTSGIINILIQSAVSEYSEVKIYNALGTIVSENTLKGDVTSIDLGKQSKGVYFISFLDVSGNPVLVKRIIVQ